MRFKKISPPIIASIVGSRKGGSSLGAINASGAINVIPIEYYVIFIVATLFSLWRSTSLNRQNTKYWLELLFAAILFSLLLAGYQILLTHSVSYYFIKSTYTPVLVLTLFYGVSVALLYKYTNDYFSKLPSIYSHTVMLIIFVSAGFLIIYQPATRTANFGLAFKENYLNSQDFNKLNRIAINAKGNNKSTVLINTGSSLNDYVYSKWVSAINLNFTQEYGDLIGYNLELADKYRRMGKSENLQSEDIILPSTRIEIIDFSNEQIVK